MTEITNTFQAKASVDGWLTANHHEVNFVEDEAANFHIEVDYPPKSQKRQRIIQPREYPDMLVLLNGVATAPEHREQMKRMDRGERERFYDSLRLQLMFAESSVEWDVDEDGVIQQVQFSYEMYFDGLTKTSLFRALLMQHRALLYIITSLNSRFGLPTLDAVPEMAGVV